MVCCTIISWSLAAMTLQTNLIDWVERLITTSANNVIVQVCLDIDGSILESICEELGTVEILLFSSCGSEDHGSIRLFRCTNTSKLHQDSNTGSIVIRTLFHVSIGNRAEDVPDIQEQFRCSQRC